MSAAAAAAAAGLGANKANGHFKFTPVDPASISGGYYLPNYLKKEFGARDWSSGSHGMGEFGVSGPVGLQ